MLNLSSLLPKFFWKRYKFTILLGSTVVSILWLISTFQKISNKTAGLPLYSAKSNVPNWPFDSPKYNIEKEVPQDWVQQEKCPACFGEDLCDSVYTKEIKLTVQSDFDASSSKYAFGKYGQMDVIVKRLGNRYFEIYDKFICGNSTSCDVSGKVMQSYVASQNALLIAELENAWKMMKKSPWSLT